MVGATFARVINSRQLLNVSNFELRRTGVHIASRARAAEAEAQKKKAIEVPKAIRLGRAKAEADKRAIKMINYRPHQIVHVAKLST